MINFPHNSSFGIIKSANLSNSFVEILSLFNKKIFLLINYNIIIFCKYNSVLEA